MSLIEERVDGKRLDSAAIVALGPLVRSRLTGAGVPANDVEDVAQEVMITLLRRSDSFAEHRGNVESWVTGVAKLSAKAWIRRQAVLAARETSLDSVAERDASPKETIRYGLIDAINRVPMAEREALTLRFVHGLPSKDIAQRLGMSDAATRKRLSRAVERLRTDPEIRKIFAF